MASKSIDKLLNTIHEIFINCRRLLQECKVTIDNFDELSQLNEEQVRNEYDDLMLAYTDCFDKLYDIHEQITLLFSLMQNHKNSVVTKLSFSRKQLILHSHPIFVT